jgi:hypothetical protein
LISGVCIDYTETAMNDRVERIESVKAGSLSGLAAGIAYGTIAGVSRYLSIGHSLPLASIVVEIAIAVSGGFLFGVTYRYIIRTDRNDHLNSGAVLAFGLVRGLAQIDVRSLDFDRLWLTGGLVAESILLFAVARYTLDYALTARWISPFKGSE